MTSKLADPWTYYPYLLLAAWPAAWDRYRGHVQDVGALPALLVAAEAGILSEHDEGVRADRYWQSKVRADLNLALWRAQAAGWFQQAEVGLDPGAGSPRLRMHAKNQQADKLYRTLTDVSWLFRSYGEDSVRDRMAVNPESPDLKWWIATIQGDEALSERKAEIQAAKRERDRQARPLGLHRTQ